MSLKRCASPLAIRGPMLRQQLPQAVAELALGADEKAAARYRRWIEINGNFSLSHLYLAAALAAPRSVRRGTGRGQSWTCP